MTRTNMANKNSHLEREDGDKYYTPPGFVNSLLDVIAFSKKEEVIDPFAGRGDIINVFNAWGFNTVGYDLKPDDILIRQKDYRDIDFEKTHNDSVVVTNPPFRIKNECLNFLIHNFRVGRIKKIALLLSSTGLNTGSSFFYLSELSDKIEYNGQFDFRFVHETKVKRGAMFYAWFVFDRESKYNNKEFFKTRILNVKKYFEFVKMKGGEYK